MLARLRILHVFSAWYFNLKWAYWDITPSSFGEQLHSHWMRINMDLMVKQLKLQGMTE
jgi:hypothetical protein